MEALVTYAEGIAIALGLVAVGIAVWDHVQDRVLVWAGCQVTATSTVGTIQLGASLQPQIGVIQQTRTVTIGWKVRNRLSYPVIATFSATVSADQIVRLQLGGDIVGLLASNMYPLPPRQPLGFWVQLELRREWVGTFSPVIHLATSGRRSKIQGDPIVLTEA